MKNVFEAIAEKIISGKCSGAISGYQTEYEQRIMNKISFGWEIEDPDGTYDAVDRLMSAAGTVEELFDGDEVAAEEYLNSL